MKIPTEKASVAHDANASPRKVTRTRVACTECRTRKYKCDGKMPTCSSCDMRAGTECVYPDPEGRKRLSYKVAFEEMAKKIATLEANAEEDKARILSLESKLEAVRTMKPPQAVAYENDGQPPSGQRTVAYADDAYALYVHDMQPDSLPDFSTLLVTETEAASNLQSSSSHVVPSTAPLNVDLNVLASSEDVEVWFANFLAQNLQTLS